MSSPFGSPLYAHKVHDHYRARYFDLSFSDLILPRALLIEISFFGKCSVFSQCYTHANLQSISSWPFLVLLRVIPKGRKSDSAMGSTLWTTMLNNYQVLLNSNLAHPHKGVQALLLTARVVHKLSGSSNNPDCVGPNPSHPQKVPVFQSLFHSKSLEWSAGENFEQCTHKDHQSWVPINCPITPRSTSEQQWINQTRHQKTAWACLEPKFPFASSMIHQQCTGWLISRYSTIHVSTFGQTLIKCKNCFKGDIFFSAFRYLLLGNEDCTEPKHLIHSHPQEGTCHTIRVIRAPGQRIWSSLLSWLI